GFPFISTTEISLMYTQGGKGRRIHFLLFAPNLEVVDQITEALGKKGRLDYDGRPIFGFSAIELVDMMNSISDKIEIVPAHSWTPWFGIFGEKTGFDSIEECFQEKSKHIHAIETGLSSNPPMNWRLSNLDNIQIVSFSDNHSYWPWRLGREATVLDLKELSYNNILKSIRTGEGLAETIEVDPSYGKYHVDGHRLCGVSFDPKESKKIGEICPKCKRKLTVGVLSRVEELANRPEGFQSKDRPRFRSVIPLSEIISFSLGSDNPASRKVWEIYYKLIEKFGSEFNVLFDASLEGLSKIEPTIGANIIRVREGKVKILPGFDGIYGAPVFNPEDEEKVQQMRMRSAEREVIKEKESQKTKENKKQRSLAEF
ncbi:MAG TPA: endonuclease Q family protein, partial [archaeon]|nr:endonuclease Q family protein [archaeon]